jgi:3-methyladenine DNA glycosylase/8-oxoguanine DNA glycosylase
MQFTLQAKSPFNLVTVTNSHGWVQLAPFSLHEDGVGFDYVMALDDGKVIEMSVTAVPDGAHITTPTELNTAAQAELKAKTAWILGTEQDFTEFYAAAAQEPKLAHVQAKTQGRLLRSATVFEDIVKTILTTNTTWTGTIRMTDGLVQAYGQPLPDDPARFAFPTPERLAKADMDVLQGTVKLGYRAPYVLELAQRVASGELDVEGWKTAPSAISGQAVIPTAELRKQLLALKGVGPYAAAHLLIFLGHYDAIPVDSWALKLVSTEWYDGQPVSKKDVEAAFEKWGQWQALAYWFWDWQYLQNN